MDEITLINPVVEPTFSRASAQAGKMMNVDPFPPERCAELILKSDGVDFLKKQPDASLDLVISTFAVHFMDRGSLDKERTSQILGM